MKLGNKITKLRKRDKLSQEALADKVGVTRQTISNWELNVTTPDTNQIKKLSKIFNTSIDELLDNDIRDIIEKKLSNTEELTNKTRKNIKAIVIILYSIILLFLISIIVYYTTNKDFTSDYQVEFTCYSDEKVYYFEMEETYNEDSEVIDEFKLNISECDKEKNKSCEKYEYYAGKTLSEVVENLNSAKKLITNVQGAYCK